MIVASASLPLSFLLNGREYVYADIQEYHALLDAPVNGYEAKVLDFIRQWLNGTQEFTLTTSGSTGPPSPIAVRRRQMVASARRTAAHCGAAAANGSLGPAYGRFLRPWARRPGPSLPQL